MNSRKEMILAASALLFIHIAILSTLAALTNKQSNLNRSAIQVLQTNSQMKDRINRLRLAENDLIANIYLDKIILPGRSNHAVFAGEEIDFTAKWHDAVLSSKEFRKLDKSLQTIAYSMSTPIENLVLSHEKLRKLNASDRYGRNKIINEEIRGEIFRIISLCEDFIGQNSQNYSVKHENAASFEKKLGLATAIMFAASIFSFAIFIYYIIKQRRP